jgi:hypothetical protein
LAGPIGSCVWRRSARMGMKPASRLDGFVIEDESMEHPED